MTLVTSEHWLENYDSGEHLLEKYDSLVTREQHWLEKYEFWSRVSIDLKISTLWSHVSINLENMTLWSRVRTKLKNMTLWSRDGQVCPALSTTWRAWWRTAATAGWLTGTGPATPHHTLSYRSAADIRKKQAYSTHELPRAQSKIWLMLWRIPTVGASKLWRTLAGKKSCKMLLTQRPATLS